MSLAFSRCAAGRATRRAGLLLALPLVLAASALAADQTPFRANAVDQAAAKAAVLKRADLGAGAVWKGGATKPDFSADTGCADWKPKQSDLLVTGAAASEFSANGMMFSSEVHVLQSAEMVRLDWQRTATDPRGPGCLRKRMAREFNKPQTRLVSVTRLPFPRLTAQTIAFRTLVDFVRNGSTVRVMFDFVGVGKGRSELTFVTVARYASETAVKAAEVRLARVLTARLP